jgi:hypothetical protein
MPSRTLQKRSLQRSGRGVPHPERTAGGDSYGTIDPGREKSQGEVLEQTKKMVAGDKIKLKRTR